MNNMQTTLARMMVVFYFIMLFVSLFFGDGKESVVDLFWAGLSLIFYFVIRWHGGVSRPMSTPLQWAWIAVFVSFLLSTVWSDSVGDSLLSMVRLGIGFLMYQSFFFLSSAKTITQFSWGTIALMVITVLTAIVIRLGRVLPPLPSMNLLYSAYGHNHLADLFIVAIPLVVALWLVQKKRTMLLLLFGSLLAEVLTFSRGAAVLLGVYGVGLVMLLTTLKHRAKTITLVGLCVLTMVVATFGTRYINPTINNNFSVRPQNLHASTIESSLLVTRIEYWRQALVSFRERPLFGHGPGTFFLQSLRLQKTLGFSSWFAHSFPLQLLAEVGIVGFISVMSVIGLCLWEAKRGFADGVLGYATPLLWSVMLTLFYSITEFNLDFIVIWVMFWSMLGLLSGVRKEKNIGNIYSRAAETIFLTWLIIFYIGVSAGYVVYFLSSSNQKAHRITPYYALWAVGLLDDYAKQAVEISHADNVMVNTFFRKNSKMLYMLAKAEDAGGGPLAAQTYLRALDGDPLNGSIRNDYMNYLLLHKQYDDMRIELEKRGQEGVTGVWTIPLYSVGLLLAQKGEVGYALPFWRVAAQLSPSWSHMWIEYASLLVANGNSIGARKALVRCGKDMYAGPHCLGALRHFDYDEFPPVGYYQKEIQNEEH